MMEEVKKLLLYWIRDIHAGGDLPSDLLERHLALLEIIARKLEGVPSDGWYEVLPMNGESRKYYELQVRALQRKRGWSDRELKRMLQEWVGQLRRQRLRSYFYRHTPQHSRAVPPSWWELLVLDLNPELIAAQGRGFAKQVSQQALYFAFVEEVETIPAGQGFFIADDTLVRASTAQMETRHTRFSAILLNDFFGLTEWITPLEPRNVTAAARARRRQQLSDGLSDISLPILDMLVGEDAQMRLGIAPALGDWCVLGMSSEFVDDGISLYMTNPEEGESPAPQPAGLSLLVQAPDPWQIALRDIFSLVHVPDADFGETEGEDGTPAPRPPNAPLIEQADEPRARWYSAEQLRSLNRSTG